MSQNEKVVFKNYVTNQPFLLPPSLDELIPLNHPVRVVNSVIDQIDLSKLLKMYKLLSYIDDKNNIKNSEKKIDLDFIMELLKKETQIPKIQSISPHIYKKIAQLIK